VIRATFTTRTARAVCFDLESRPSAFWWGDKTTAQITAFGWKWRDEPVAHSLVLLSSGRFRHDSRTRTVSAVRAYELFRDELTASDLCYGHNIRKFDLPLFQAGLLRNGIVPLPELRTTDTLRDFPKRHDMSASLENLANLYLPGEEGKLHLSISDWEQANQLRPEGVALARERVMSDVLLQERLRDRLLELGLLKPPRWWKP
jgi:hypothetical protein